MYLLKHGNFEFSKILSEGYNILEDEPEILSETRMADGSIKRNYGIMPKTRINIKFDRLTENDYYTYLGHFVNNEGDYEYYSPSTKTYKTKKFFVKKPQSTLISTCDNKMYKELEIVLEMCGEADA